MLQASTMSDLAKAIRESRAKSVYGAKVVPDDVFSTSGELVDIAQRAVANGEITPTGQNHTWSIVTPTAPLPTRGTNICHYRFDETTGTEAADASTNDNDLSVSGATWATGKFGNCLSFDGSNDTATVTAVSQEPLRNYLYVSCWIKPTSVAGSRPICKLADKFLLYLDAGVIKCIFTDAATDYTVTSNLTAVINTWQFVTVQFIDGQVLVGLDDLVYRGSIALTTYADEYPAAGKALTVGSDGSSFFAGLLDDLTLDANERVQDDIPIVSQISSPLDCIFWPFVENTGTNVYTTNLLGPVLAISGGSWVAGRTRYGVLFNGISDFGSCTPTAETFTGRTITVEMLVKFTADQECPLITQSGGINVKYDGAGGIVAALGGVTNASSVVGPLTVDNNWVDICIVYDGSEKACWINGQKVGAITCTGTALLSGNTLYVARDGATYSPITVDRIRLYRGALEPYYRYVGYWLPNVMGFAPTEEHMMFPS